MLRPATAADAQGMADTHAEAFEAPHDAPWSAHEIGSLLAGPGGYALVAEAGSGLGGFILCRAMAGEAEVLTLATSPAYRRQGVARALLQAAIAAARSAGAEAMFLEVAADNVPAISLYRAAGFIRTGRRAGYYARDQLALMDALVLRRDLSR